MTSWRAPWTARAPPAPARTDVDPDAPAAVHPGATVDATPGGGHLAKPPGPHVAPPHEQFVRVSEGLLGHGHRRVIAARIVSLRTGRPMFDREGPNAILRNPSKLLEEVPREQKAVEWRLAIRP